MIEQALVDDYLITKSLSLDRFLLLPHFRMTQTAILSWNITESVLRRVYKNHEDLTLATSVS